MFSLVTTPSGPGPSAGRGLRYRAFFEALGSLAEGTPDWRAVLAGLVTLRYVDAWAACGVHACELDAERQAVEGAIEALSCDMPERVLLRSLIAVSDAEPLGDVSRLGPLLLAYGRSLQKRSKWALAADVHSYVHQWCAALARTPVDGELAASAALHSAQCYRTLGESALAKEAYQRAATVGRAWQAEYAVLTARVGLANLAADGGDLAAAEEQLAAILADAESESTREVRAHAWHDRAAVAHRRGHKAESIEYAYEAWVATREPATRERILRDLAAIALAAGYRDAARDASAVLATTAKKAWVRWLATINLMAIATLDRLEAEFTRLRRGLAEVALPPVIEAEYLYSAALGDYAFGRRTAAIEGLRRAVTIAQDHRLDQVLQRAESALGRVRNGIAPPVHGPTTTPERLVRVSAALSNARMMVSARDNQMHPLRGVVDGTR